MCILTIEKNVDEWPSAFHSTNFQNELSLYIHSTKFLNQFSLSNQNNAIISPKIDNTASPHPIKNTTALYKSLLLLAFLFIYYPFTVYLLFRCYFSVISLLFLYLVPQIPPNSSQYSKKFLLRIVHCCTSLFLTPLLIQWVLFIHSIQ